MENRIPNSYKLKAMEVVKEGLYLFKNNYKLLLKISLLGFFVSMINTVFSYTRTIPEIDTIYLVITLAISLLTAYVQVKLAVTMYIWIYNRYSGKLITFREAFIKSKDSIWSYIGTSILFGLIVFPFPALVGYGVFLYIKAKLLKYLLLLMVAIPFICLAIIYQFAPLASVVEKGKASEEEKASYFKLSKRLVKNNFWRIALLVISMVIIINLPSLFTTNLNPWVKSLSVFNQKAVSLSHDLLYAFISPAVACVIVVLYLTLRKEVEYKLE